MQNLQHLLDGMTHEDAVQHKMNAADMMISWLKENQGADQAEVDSMMHTYWITKEVMGCIGTK